MGLNKKSKYGRVKISDLCTITSSKRIYASDYKENGVPFYRGKEIIEKSKGTDEISTKLFISESKFNEIKNKYGIPNPGDLLLTSVGSLGIPYVIKERDRFYFKDGNLTWFRNFNDLDSNYLYYWLLSPNGKAELKKSTIGASQPAFTIALLNTMEIELPPLEIQNHIASILSAYDVLIENNTRRIRILEEMAQAIYREWFVNFRLPAVAGAPGVKLRITTPEEKKAIGKDVIPEGWEVVRLGDVAEVNRSNINTKNAPTEINYIDIASVEIGEIKNIQNLPFKDAPSRARRVVNHGDIIWSTVRPNRKSYALILNPISNLIVSTGFAVISAIDCPFTYLYSTVTTDKFTDYLSNNTTGAAYPAVNTDVILNALIIKPDDNTINYYHEITSYIYSFSNILKQRNNNLRQTRDLLLPKLVSGEVEV